MLVTSKISRKNQNFQKLFIFSIIIIVHKYTLKCSSSHSNSATLAKVLVQKSSKFAVIEFPEQMSSYGESRTTKSEKRKQIQHVWRVPPWTTHLVGDQTPPGTSVKHRYVEPIPGGQGSVPSNGFVCRSSTKNLIPIPGKSGESTKNHENLGFR